jgi:uncharacterized protein (UPF0261 family)
MGKVYVVGTLDTKRAEHEYVRNLIEAAGVETVLVDVGTTDRGGEADVTAAEIAAFHPDGVSAVFVEDRGESVTAMSEALVRFLAGRDDVAGIISLGGSGATALATPAMRSLPVGVPKLMVSTMASGDVRGYVGPSDIMMMYAVTDVAGLNRISTRVLGNAAHAIAGAAAWSVPEYAARPALGLTMYGLTTPCVSTVTDLLSADYDCLVFHATGTGGMSMENLVDSGLITGVIDVTTTEVTDHVVGGIMSAGPGRLDAIARTRVPYVGSCGALDIVAFGRSDTVPSQFADRTFHRHNAQVTLMRATPEESRQIGRFIAEKLNRCWGPVRFFLPEGGLSGLDVPGGVFRDPEADSALFDAIESDFIEADDRRLVRSPLHVNDPAFAALLAEAFLEIAGGG